MIHFWAQAKWGIQNKGTAVFTKSVTKLFQNQYLIIKNKKKESIYWSPNPQDAQENRHKPPPAEILTRVPGLFSSPPQQLQPAAHFPKDSNSILSLSNFSTPALSCPAVLPPEHQPGGVGRKPLEGSGSSQPWAGNPCNHSNEAKSWEFT